MFRIKKQLDKHSNRTSKRNCSDSVMLGNFMASLFSEVEKTVLRAAFELQSKQESQNKVKRQCDGRKRQLSV